MPPDSIAPAHRLDAFGATRWSLVMALRGDAGDRHQPLDELTRSYAYPVYAYLRRCGHDPAAAARLLAGFFARLGDEIAHADPATFGRFRSFLFDRLQTFGERAPTADEALPATPGWLDFDELERRLLEEHAAAAGPEAVFTRSFALQVLARGREKLREETRRSDRETMFALLEPYLTRDPSADTADALARRLGIGRLAVEVAIRRLRQRFRQVVEAELQETVASPADLHAERDLLHRTLVDPP